MLKDKSDYLTSQNLPDRKKMASILQEARTTAYSLGYYDGLEDCYASGYNRSVEKAGLDDFNKGTQQYKAIAWFFVIMCFALIVLLLYCMSSF